MATRQAKAPDTQRPLTLRVPGKMLTDLDRIAAAQGRSRNSQIRMALAEHIRQQARAA